MATRVFMYKPRFVPLVESGAKTQTVRRERRAPVRPGDMLSHRAWTGSPYRSRQRVLCEAPCVSVEPVIVMIDVGYDAAWVNLNGVELSPKDLHDFVRADGFRDQSDFVAYYDEAGVHRFSGVLIRWRFPEVSRAD